MKFKEGDKVRQKHTRATRIGTIIGIWENDEYIFNKTEKILFVSKGEYKVSLDNDLNNGYITFSENELLKI